MGQMNLLDHIKSHILSHGYPPSIRELQELTGAASTNTIWRALRKLEASGDITVEKGQSRAIRLNGYKIVLVKWDEQDTQVENSEIGIIRGNEWKPEDRNLI